MTQFIPLHNKKGDVTAHAIVDDQDYPRIATKHWSFVPRDVISADSGYAICTYRENGKQHNIYMHRFITDAPRGVQVDHKNGHTLDNTQSNLRFATRTQNMQNQAKARIVCTSIYKGVNAVPYTGYQTRNKERWRATIQVNGKRLHLGYHPSETDAARAYDAAALQHYGEFARLNFPSESHL